RNRTDLIEVLAVQYPVIRRLVGDLSFRIVARRFILSEPPSIPIAPSFGDNFPRFLRGQSNTASFEYVADIAQLELVRRRARRAADVRPLAAETLLSLRMNGSTGCPSPSTLPLPWFSPPPPSSPPRKTPNPTST